MKKKSLIRIFNYIFLLLFVFFGTFAIVKIVQTKRLDATDISWWRAIFLSSCLWAYLSNRYCKVVCKYDFSIKALIAITVGSFFLGAIFTRFGANIIALILNIVFDRILKIDSYLREYNSTFPPLIGIVSSVIVIIAYQISVEKNMISKAEIQKKE